MLRVGIVLLSLAACFTKPPRPDGVAGDGKLPSDAPPAEGWLEGYGFRKRVTVTLPPSITSPLINFPVGISRFDADLTLHADNNGSDLIATAADGVTRLASELAAYDAGTFELWVRLPELGATTDFYVYYGGDNEAVSPAIWDGPFAGIWHLSETGTARDSTRTPHHMTATGSQIPVTIPDGVFGPARRLDGNDSLNGGDPADGSLDFDTGSFSYSLWVRQSSTLGLYDTPFYKGCAASDRPGYCWLLGSEGWFAKIFGGVAADPEMGTAVEFANRWVHLVAVVDRDLGSFFAYADAAVRDTKSLATVGSLSTNEPIQIGRGTTEAFAGDVDEVRVYNVALTPDWITAELHNGTDPNFLAFGDEEKAP